MPKMFLIIFDFDFLSFYCYCKIFTIKKKHSNPISNDYYRLYFISILFSFSSNIPAKWTFNSTFPLSITNITLFFGYFWFNCILFNWYMLSFIPFTNSSSSCYCCSLDFYLKQITNQYLLHFFLIDWKKSIRKLIKKNQYNPFNLSWNCINLNGKY